VCAVLELVSSQAFRAIARSPGNALYPILMDSIPYVRIRYITICLLICKFICVYYVCMLQSEHCVCEMLLSVPLMNSVEASYSCIFERFVSASF